MTDSALACPIFRAHLAGGCPNARMEMRSETEMALTLSLDAGFYRLDFTSRPGSVDPASLYVYHRGWEEGRGFVERADAVPLGPMDWLDGEWYVPVYAVELDGAPLGELWFDIPAPDDLQAGIGRTSMGVVIRAAGEHTFVFRCAYANHLPPSCLAEITLAVDERAEASFPVDAVPARRPRLLPQAVARGLRPAEIHRQKWEALEAALSAHMQQNLATASPIITETMDQVLLRQAVEFGLGRRLFAHDTAGTDMAVQAALRLCRCPVWGSGRPGDMGADNDIGTGLNLASVARVYDWLYDELAPDAQDELQQALIRKGGEIYRFQVLQRCYWPCGYLQNHFSLTCYGLLSAALALLHEHPEAAEWAALCRHAFLEAARLQSLDGSSHPLEAAWGAGYIVLALELLRQAAGECPPRPDFFTRLPAFLRAGGRSQSAACLFTLSAWLQKPSFQWLALQKKAGTLDDILLCDPDLPAATPDPLPVHAFFDDGGWLFINDGPARVEFVAGFPYSRAHFTELTRYNMAHYCPNQGNVTIHLDGKMALGQHQATYRKTTDLYNCVTFNGAGQVMSDYCWLAKDRAEHYPVMQCTTADDRVDAAVDLTCCYLPEARLRQYTRTLRHAGGSCCELEDRVAFLTPDNLVEVFFQTPGTVTVHDGRHITLTSEHGQALHLEFLDAEPDSIDVYPAVVAKTYRYTGHFAQCCRARFTVPGDAFCVRTRVSWEG